VSRCGGTFGNAAFDAELVALRIGHHHEAPAARLAMIVYKRRGDGYQPFDFLIAGSVDRLSIERQAILEGLALGFIW
jgi:hypothetical protein